MGRFFQQRGSALAEVSVLDRLAYLGTRTMGALTYHPPADPGDQEARILEAAAARWRAHARRAAVGTKTARMVGNAIQECLARVRAK